MCTTTLAVLGTPIQAPYILNRHYMTIDITNETTLGEIWGESIELHSSNGVGDAMVLFVFLMVELWHFVLLASIPTFADREDFDWQVDGVSFRAEPNTSLKST